MPTISEFFGIVIKINYDDHAPPHFHAFYQNDAAIISIDSFMTIKGHLPKRVRSLVLEWALDHREELLADWHLAEQHKPLLMIDPLE